MIKCRQIIYSLYLSDLNETAQTAIIAYYEKQGLLYDVHTADDKEHFLIRVPSGKFGGISIKLKLDFLTELIEVLQKFKETLDKEGVQLDDDKGV